MAQFKPKATPEPSSHGRPIPFRSRKPENVGSQHVSWAPTNSTHELKSHIMSSYSPADKENVKSWLDSTSPTSVLDSHNSPQHVQTGGQFNPPTPSPVCSPSPSSLQLSSPDLSTAELQQADAVPPHHIAQQNPSTETNSKAAQDSGKKLDTLAATSARRETDMVTEAPPDSPTGSAISSGSEGGLLALLASKLLSYKENGRRSSRYARESSGPIDEKHVLEDRSKKPAVEEITTFQNSLPPQVPPSPGSDLYRTSSEAVSEHSLGSAYDRTLSMEFDSMLAAAVATGIRQASVLPDQPQQQLPDIQEDTISRSVDAGLHQRDETDPIALTRVGDLQGASCNDTASRLISTVTEIRRGQESEDMDFHSTLSELPLSSRSSSSSRRALNINRDCSPGSTSSGSTGENSLAMILDEHTRQTASDCREPVLSSSCSSSGRADQNMAPIVPLSPKQALEKVRRDKAYAQALAFQDAQSTKCVNRYIRQESKILAWENQQKIDASLRLKQAELKLEQKKAKAVEKMENEIARAHKRAEERKASAEAVRASKTAKALQLADLMRKTGNSSGSKHGGCFPF